MSDRGYSVDAAGNAGVEAPRSRSGSFLLPPSLLSGRGLGHPPARRARVALYSHDTMGLGHMRRNLLLAQTFVEAPLQPTVLLVAGAREVGAFALPAGVDSVALPALRKNGRGEYAARHLDLTLPEIVEVRSRIIDAALTGFEPDVLVVDNVPRGAVRELDRALDRLRANGRARCVLGLRDVLDEPETVRLEWERAANEQAIREYYDALWIYGDPRVYPLAELCGFSSDVVSRMRYTGYLDQTSRTDGSGRIDVAGSNNPQLPPGRVALCLLGGGQDGARLAHAFAGATFPADMTGVILGGPFLPEDAFDRLQAAAKASKQLRVQRFAPDIAPLLERADLVVAMGGYNTVTELLAYEKRSLIVPRVTPRREQLIRAQRLQDLGIFEMLHPNDLEPRAIGEWLARAPAGPALVRDRIDLRGLDRLPTYLEDVLAGSESFARTGGSSLAAAS